MNSVIPISRDNLGYVFEPLDSISTAVINNSHVVISHPGSIRGNHYHLIGTETIVCTGKAQVSYKYPGKEIVNVIIEEDQAIRFVFDAGVSYAVKNVGNKDIVIIYYSTVYDDNSNNISDIVIPQNLQHQDLLL